MIAFSSAVSWLIFGAVAAVAVAVYLAASAWLDRQDEWIGELIRSAHSQTWSEADEPQVRVTGGGPYDHEARGDFE